MEVIQQFLDEARAAWRFRWWAVGAAWVTCVVGWIVVATLPNVYEASARVYVDANTGLTPLLQGLAVEQNVDAQLMLVRQTLLGRPALEKVARKTDLHLTAQTPQQMENLILGLQTQIEITNVLERTQVRGRPTTDSLYEIRYRHGDRQKAVAVVREVLDTFVEDTLGGGRAGSVTAQRFLTDQVQDYAKRLSEAELALAEFKKANLGLVPGEGGGYFERVQMETAALRQARSDLSVAAGRAEELRRQLRGEREGAQTLPAAAASATMPATDTSLRLAEAQKRLDELMLRYTDRHPDVTATRETIRQLEERQQAELTAMRDGTGPATASLSSNPVYQSIQMTLNQTEVEIASLRRQIGQREATIQQLQRMANTAPEVEAEYATLTRGYEVTRAQYNSLLERLERARLSEQAEQTGIVRFDVIDPPVAGFEPVAPNRPLLVAAILIAGLGLGAGLAYLMHLMRPVFMNARKLTEITGLPVLGAVSEAWLSDRRNARRREVLALTGAAAGLVLAFGVVFWWQSAGGYLLRAAAG